MLRIRSFLWSASAPGFVLGSRCKSFFFIVVASKQGFSTGNFVQPRLVEYCKGKDIDAVEARRNMSIPFRVTDENRMAVK